MSKKSPGEDSMTSESKKGGRGEGEKGGRGGRGFLFDILLLISPSPLFETDEEDDDLNDLDFSGLEEEVIIFIF